MPKDIKSINGKIDTFIEYAEDNSKKTKTMLVP